MASRFSILIYLLAVCILLLAAWPLVRTLRTAASSWFVVALLTACLAHFGMALSVVLWPQVRALNTVRWALYALSMLGFVAFCSGVIK